MKRITDRGQRKPLLGYYSDSGTVLEKVVTRPTWHWRDRFITAPPNYSHLAPTYIISYRRSTQTESPDANLKCCTSKPWQKPRQGQADFILAAFVLKQKRKSITASIFMQNQTSFYISEKPLWVCHD